MKSSPVLLSLIHALATAFYTAGIAAFLFNADKLFDDKPSPISVAIMLMLMVLSASITGALIFAKPVLLFLEGKKKDAIKFFGYTLGWLLTVIVVTLMMRQVL